MPHVRYWISTTIKKEFMLLILGGEKKSEFKGWKPFWEKRLDHIPERAIENGEVGINFLCGRLHYKYRVTEIAWYEGHKEIAGEAFEEWYEICFDERIHEPESYPLEVFDGN